MIFDGDSIRAILAGHKTRTTRIIKRSDMSRLLRKDEFSDPFANSLRWLDECEWEVDQSKGMPYAAQPYGGFDLGIRSRIKAGDVVYAKEVWASTAQVGEDPPWIVYQATDPGWSAEHHWEWRSRMFMPRKEARIIFRIESVNILRIQSLTRADICREGWPGHEKHDGPGGVSYNERDAILGLESVGIDEGDDECIEWWADRWDAINTKPGTRWDDNPWCWSYEFDVLSTTGWEGVEA